MSFKNTSDWLNFDREHLWHPYTSMTEPLPCYPIVSAQGVRLTLADGNELIDGMSSWWAAIHGYNHPSLNAALIEQLQSMSHVMFGGLTHLPAVTLGKHLVELTAPPLEHVFLADSGSVAVEVAIKMAIQYWYAQGETNKQKLLTVRGGYHGDTLAGMSVCDPVNGMHNLFQGVLPQHFFAPRPECYADGTSNIDTLEILLSKHQDDIAAVIIEPIVQGAGGMHFYCAGYLQQLRQLCDKYSVLLILDEIATGFGRTGTLFAYEQAKIVPDILCLGKALTGGYMSLAATLTTTRVAQGISADTGVLMHGPTFMANPLACQVANASIELLLASPWKSRIAQIERQLMMQLSSCAQYPVVKQVRVKGAIGVVELHQAVDMKTMQADFVAQKVWIRPFNKLVYIMPPYIINESDLSRLTSTIHHILKHLTLNT